MSKVKHDQIIDCMERIANAVIYLEKHNTSWEAREEMSKAREMIRTMRGCYATDKTRET